MVKTIKNPGQKITEGSFEYFTEMEGAKLCFGNANGSLSSIYSVSKRKSTQ